MKRYVIYSLVCACLTAFTPDSIAQISIYETPEYSGPTARFDRELDTRRDQENALRVSRQRLEDVQRIKRNDLAVERQNILRGQRVQNEMTRKRDESLRSNQQYILKTNE